MPSALRRPRAAQASLACAVLAGCLVLLAVAAHPAAAAFAGRNGLLAYDGHWSDSGLISLRRSSGRGLRQIAVPGRPIDPAFSPLGLRIAFATDGQIWVAYADGTMQRQLTATLLPSREPAWSPDGTRLTFSTGARGASDLYRIQADGTRLKRLTYSAADDAAPAWSSRNRIAFVRRNSRGDGDLRVMTPAGGSPTLLTHGPADDEMPDWSPDGRRVAFTRGSPAKRDVYVIGADGSGLRRLTKLRHGVSSPTWSPNGRFIAFATGRSGHRAVDVVPSRGGRVRQVAPGTADASSLDWQSRGHDPVIAAAGDIACDPNDRAYDDGVGRRTACHQLQTSNILLGMDLSGVLAIGDTQYNSGTSPAYVSFDQTWGRLKPLMHPAVGNHESRDVGTSGYYDYFDGVGGNDGPAGPRDEGWYSWDLGRWHLVALNTECSGPTGPTDALTTVDCSSGSPEEQWLRADLAAHPSRCTLVYFHHPLVASGLARFNSGLQPFWRDMMAAGVDVVLSGHDHAYERFGPLDADGRIDRARGIREFIVGTGGKSFSIMDHIKPGSQVRQSSVFGVLSMSLGQDSYHYRFVPEAGGRFTDEGDTRCH